jgi:hypothetical protein
MNRTLSEPERVKLAAEIAALQSIDITRLKALRGAFDEARVHRSVDRGSDRRGSHANGH